MGENEGGGSANLLQFTPLTGTKGLEQEDEEEDEEEQEEEERHRL